MLTFIIDNNLINARQKDEHMNFLEDLHSKGFIRIMMPYPAHKEAMRFKMRDENYEEYFTTEYQNRRAEGTKNRPMKAEEYQISYIIESDLSEEDKRIRQRIKEILLPGSKGDLDNDTEIVFIAYFYRYILISHDGGSKTQEGGIIGNREKLNKELGIKIMKKEEAVHYVKEAVLKI